VTGAVLDLAAELSEHLIEPGALAEWTAGFVAAVEALPRDRGTGPYAEVAKVLQAAKARGELAAG